MDMFSAVERDKLRELEWMLEKDPAVARGAGCWARTALMLSCVEGEEAFGHCCCRRRKPLIASCEGLPWGQEGYCKLNNGASNKDRACIIADSSPSRSA
jgi:hypothetical protein